ncbi:MAG: hypothetical protein OQJ89_07180 [Kangiellaceae bacterium]|nr:hypothetical protein [Kangiellaceae bacterium]MCW8998355.1 hypothetical protein [Kangiellaceae bacterium]MCW9016728.1 hypothetical protein [Kangiellaceae bacterium]
MMKNKIILSLVILAVGLVSLGYWLKTSSGTGSFSEDSTISLAKAPLPEQDKTESNDSDEVLHSDNSGIAQEATHKKELRIVKEVAREAADNQNELPPLENWTGEDLEQYLVQFKQAAIDSEVAFNNTQKYRELIVQKAAELESLFDLEEIACSEGTCISILNWFGEDLNKVQSSFFASPEFNSGDVTFQRFTRKALGNDGTVILVFNSR